MNFNHLQFVLEVSRLGSFTKASQKCCVTQPTLSNGIKQLEHQLGGELFIRTTRQVDLTPFGRHLLPSIRAISDAQKELVDNAKLYFEPEHKLLSIGFSPLVDMRIIDALVSPFLCSNEDVYTYFKECFIGAISERLAEGTIHLAIRPVEPRSVNIEHEYYSMNIYKEPVFVVPRDDPRCPITGQGPIIIEDAVHDIYALTPNICGHANATRAWFSQQGQTIKEYPGQAMSYQVMQDWASLGLASAILPWSKIMPEYRMRARQLFFTEGNPVFLSFQMIWHKNHQCPQPLSEFLSHCKACLINIIDGLHIDGELFQVVGNKDKRCH